MEIAWTVTVCARTRHATSTNNPLPYSYANKAVEAAHESLDNLRLIPKAQ
jgi:hypothetical protein